MRGPPSLSLSVKAIALVGRPYTSYYNVFCFSVHICHSLSSAIRLAAGSPPSVHRPTLSIHAVLRLPGKHFPSISPSVTAITSPSLLLFQCPYLANFRFFSCSSSPFCSGTPIFCRTQTLVLYSVQLIRSTRLQHHNSNAVIRFSSHFFTAQLSDPYNTVATLRFSIGCNRLQPIEKYSVSPTLWP